MEGKQKFSWRKRAASFRYAFSGIIGLVRYEHNARIHLAATLIVLALGWVFRIASWEWVAVLLCIGTVWALEAVNSAVEALADHVSPQFAPLIKKAKDFAAAAVLLFAIMAVAVGAIVFVPRIINLFSVWE